MKEALNPPSRRLPKARWTEEYPKNHFVKTSKPPPRESHGRKRGREWKEIRKPRRLAKIQNESRESISATLCRPPCDVMRTDTAPASAREGERFAKGQMDFARGRPQIRSKKPSEAPFFPAFHTPGNFFAARNFRLCGKTQISFSKEIPFLPHKNARCGGEMFHTGSSHACFLTIRGLFPSFRLVTAGRNQIKTLTF